MPITGPASYLSTTDEFLTHWGAADAIEIGSSSPVPKLRSRPAELNV